MNDQDNDIAAIFARLMPQEPEETAKHANLRYVNDGEAGLRRKRWGRGFTYLDTKGEHIPEGPLRERCESLAIPPAWTDVWICADPHGHIQATGRDDEGRKQYIYHPRWEEMRNRTKFNRLILFGRALPPLREEVDGDMRKHGLPRERVVAVVVDLLDKTHIRIGNEAYAANGSFGLTTLQVDHLDVSATKLHFEFTGKSGKEQEVDLRSRRLARVVKRCQELPGQDLFQYFDDEGNRHSITSTDVNDYLKKCMGRPFTAKDFRTWGGTVVAMDALSRHVRAGDEPVKKHVTEAIKEAAAALGNTPAVCRDYYVHPDVTEAYLDGRLLVDEPVFEGLSPVESDLLRILCQQANVPVDALMAYEQLP